MEMNVLRFLFGVFGNATALFLFLAPMMTFKKIIRSKSTESFSGFPYVMTLFNCLSTSWYGLPFVSPNNMLVTTINATGALIETAYIVIFLFYAPKSEKIKIGGLFGVILTLCSSVAVVSLIAFPDHRRRKVLCGLAATVASSAMYASPLSVMLMVIKTKSVEYMPFPLSLFVFLCGTSWFIYGLLGHDPFVTVSSGVGCGLGAIQLLMYFVYCNDDRKKHKAASTLEISKQQQQAQIKLGSFENPNAALSQHSRV